MTMKVFFKRFYVKRVMPNYYGRGMKHRAEYYFSAFDSLSVR